MVSRESVVSGRNETDPQLHRCSFTFDPDNFPDPKAYLSEIKTKYGVKICVWSECASALALSGADPVASLSQPVHLSIVAHLPGGGRGWVPH